MPTTVEKPAHIKYRREAEGGLVYDHENYGYEDASMYTVTETVIDVLEFVDGECSRRDLDEEFSAPVIDSLIDRGVLTRVE